MGMDGGDRESNVIKQDGPWASRFLEKSSQRALIAEQHKLKTIIVERGRERYCFKGREREKTTLWRLVQRDGSRRSQVCESRHCSHVIPGMVWLTDMGWLLAATPAGGSRESWVKDSGDLGHCQSEGRLDRGDSYF